MKAPGAPQELEREGKRILRHLETNQVIGLEEDAFVFASNGLRVTLDEAAAARGVGRVTGSFEEPIGDPPQLTVEAFEATPTR